MTAARVSEHYLGRQFSVYRENFPPSTSYQSTNSLSSSLSIPIFQHGDIWMLAKVCIALSLAVARDAYQGSDVKKVLISNEGTDQ